MEVQLSLAEAIVDLLRISPVCLPGFAAVGALLYRAAKKADGRPSAGTIIGALLLYYYLCVVLSNIVGIPTAKELIRLTALGEGWFHPNISTIPLVDGLSPQFVLNIFCFMPLGLLCPVISRAYQRLRAAALMGLSLSLTVELAQLFTLYRATDIDDLLANTIGTVLGWLCFCLAARLGLFRRADPVRDRTAGLLPAQAAAAAFVLTFIG